MILLMPYTDESLYYRMTGAGTPVVYIHGAAGTGQLFANQFQAFRDIARCYFIDLPGHGQSRNTGELSLKNYADAVAGLIQNLGESVVLLGHSMGGAIAIEVALRRPKLLRALVLVGTGCSLPVSPKILTGLESDYEGTLDLIVRYCFSKAVDPELLAMARADMAKVDPAIARTDFQICNEFDRCQDVASIAVPTYIIAGEKDVMTPPASSEQLHRLIPNSKLAVVSGGSHMAMLQQQAEFNAILRDFLVLR